MISNADIMDAICDAAANIDDFAMTYTNLVPNGFERPSLLIEPVTTIISDANKSCVQVKEYFTLTLFDKTDGYRRTKTENLLILQNKVLALFRAGYFKVEDRALRVLASSAGRNVDEAYIDIQFEFMDNRTDDIEVIPIAEKIESRFIHKGE